MNQLRQARSDKFSIINIDKITNEIVSYQLGLSVSQLQEFSEELHRISLFKSLVIAEKEKKIEELQKCNQTRLLKKRSLFLNETSSFKTELLSLHELQIRQHEEVISYFFYAFYAFILILILSFIWFFCQYYNIRNPFRRKSSNNSRRIPYSSRSTLNVFEDNFPSFSR